MTALLVPLSLMLRVDENATPPFLKPSGLTWLKDTLPSLVSASTCCCCLPPATVVEAFGVATSSPDNSSSSRLFRKTFLRLEALNTDPSFVSAMLCEERERAAHASIIRRLFRHFLHVKSQDKPSIHLLLPLAFYTTDYRATICMQLAVDLAWNFTILFIRQ